jgi:hypothetical protein
MVLEIRLELLGSRLERVSLNCFLFGGDQNEKDKVGSGLGVGKGQREVTDGGWGISNCQWSVGSLFCGISSAKKGSGMVRKINEKECTPSCCSRPLQEVTNGEITGRNLKEIEGEYRGV